MGKNGKRRSVRQTFPRDAQRQASAFRRSIQHGPDWKSRHLRYATRVSAEGYEARPLQPQHRAAATALVRAHIHGIDRTWQMSPETGGAVMLDRHGRVVACLVMGLVSLDGNLMALIQHLVVAPDVRGLGIGVVLLGVAPQVVQAKTRGKPIWWVGQCEESMRAYYQAAGFKVGQPNEPLMLPGNVPAPVANGNAFYTCWFSIRR